MCSLQFVLHGYLEVMGYIHNAQKAGGSGAHSGLIWPWIHHYLVILKVFTLLYPHPVAVSGDSLYLLPMG